MNLTHGAMAALMLAHTNDFDNAEQRASYSPLFSTLLFAIAFKSNFEALEFSGLGHWAAAGTVLSVLGGVALALFRSRKVRISWRRLRLTASDIIGLLILFVLYLGIVAQSFLMGNRA